MVSWIVLAMFGNGATTGLGQTTTTMRRPENRTVPIAVSTTSSAVVRGIVADGAQAAFEPPPVFGIILLAIHSGFAWFVNKMFARSKSGR